MVGAAWGALQEGAGLTTQHSTGSDAGTQQWLYEYNLLKISEYTLRTGFSVYLNVPH